MKSEDRVTPRNISGWFEWDELLPCHHQQASKAFSDIYNELIQGSEYTARKHKYLLENGELVGREEHEK